MALALCLIATGCDISISTNKQDQGNGGGTQASSNNGTSSSDSQQPNSSSGSQQPNSNSGGQQASSSSQSAAPAGYVLDQSCSKGSGSTGKDIYYSEPSSDAYRFACVHKNGMSPYLSFSGNPQFDSDLANAGGPYCAFSRVDGNVGCALTPISEGDLMNVPPQQGQGVPTGYVLEDSCQQGTGATGKTIYYRPPKPPSGTAHMYWYECVHRTESPSIVNVVSSPSSGGEPYIVGDSGPYCAFSEADNNIGCALEPITSKDLMNPS